MKKIKRTFTPTIFYVDGSSVNTCSTDSQEAADALILQQAESEIFSYATISVVLTVEEAFDPAIGLAKAKAAMEAAQALSQAAEEAAAKDAEEKEGGV